jgi:hypothetical protein
VRTVVRRALVVAAFVTAVAGAVALFSDGLRSIVADAWLLALAGVLLLALFRTARLLAPTTPSRLDAALAGMRPREPRPPDLSLARDISLSGVNGFHFHTRLRPVLRMIASHRLRTRYGVELDAEPGRARELVGARAWEVVDPDRRPPHDRLARGPDVHSIAAVVDELERL